MKKYDAIVVGSGFAGLSTAYFLSRACPGRSFLVMESEATYGQHASGRNAALFRQAVANFQVASWIQDSLALLKNPPADWSEPEVLKMTGSILTGKSSRLDPLIKIVKSLAAKAEAYPSGTWPASLSPWLQTHLERLRPELLLHCPEDGVVDIQALQKNLFVASQNYGVEYRFNSPVHSLEKTGDAWRVQTSSGEEVATCVINAAGAWAPAIAELAGLSRPCEMQPMRRHLFQTESSSGHIEIGDSEPYFWDLTEEYYFRRSGDGFLMSSGDETAQAAGPAEVAPGMERVLAEKLRNFHFDDLAALPLDKVWACLRTKSVDGNFCVREDLREPSFFWVAALGGHGVSAALGVGQAAARLVADFFNPK